MIRLARHTLTQRPARAFEVVLGHDAADRPHVTVHPWLGTSFSLADPDVAEQLAHDLLTAVDHMRNAV